MRIITLVISFLSFATLSVYGQDWQISIGGNYGTYSMSSLKDFQRRLTSSIEYPVKVVENFPSRPAFELGVMHSFNRNSIGGYFSAASTAGRLSYADYSGELNYDQVIKMVAVAFNFEHTFIKKKQWEVYFSLRSGFAFNDFELKSFIRIDTESDSEAESFKSNNMTAYPGIGGRVNFNNFFFKPELGYEFHFYKSDFHVKGEDEMYIEIDSQRFNAGWDGIRLSVQIGYQL